jgi:hypothetical protein
MIIPTSTTITNNAMIPIAPDESIAAQVSEVQRIWLVEQHQEYEVYSNGLRVETRHTVPNEPRTYQPLDRNRGYEFSTEALTVPAGIVFHTTESLMAPFEAERNKELKRAGEELLGYLQRHRAYHYLIDRFGRVFRVVQESDAANHAGNSIWSDRRWAYLNLNHSFLGVAFEAQSRDESGRPSVSPAQIHSGRVLTDMLRSKYRLAAINCVAHAQVSVNPSNMRIAYHTDWAKDLPFAELGLTDNYSIPLPSVAEFGFTYDSYIVKMSGDRPWRGLLAATTLVDKAAEASGQSAADLRAAMQKRYRERLAVVKNRAAAEESN